ncbi:MAG: hypothetical protein MHMPM18_002860 [Marteilia pararefringens]
MLLIHGDGFMYDGEVVMRENYLVEKEGRGIMINMDMGQCFQVKYESDICVESINISSRFTFENLGAEEDFDLNRRNIASGNSSRSRLSSKSTLSSIGDFLSSDDICVIDEAQKYHEIEAICEKKLYESFAIYINQFDLDIDHVYEDGNTLLSRSIVIFTDH